MRRGKRGRARIQYNVREREPPVRRREFLEGALTAGASALSWALLPPLSARATSTAPAARAPSIEDHPMHLHGHMFDIVAFSGRRLAYPLPKDTSRVPAGGTCAWRFIADSPPGRRLLHCHNLVHMMDGMMNEVDYT
jgi:hypothetical protein